jgi:hypothetical protein
MSQSYPPGPPGPPPFDPQTPEESPRRSSGLAWKILLGIFGGGLVLIVICVGVGYFVLQNIMTMDPAKVRSLAQEIAIIEVPDYFQPLMSMSITPVRMAFFEGEDHRGVFVLLDASDPKLRENRAAFETEMRNRMNQQMQGRFEQGEEVERQTETFEIKGESVEMEVVKLETEDGTVYHEVSGSFEGSENLAYLFVKAPDDELSLAEIRQMIESIE